jgi:hypothetical protein
MQPPPKSQIKYLVELNVSNLDEDVMREKYFVDVNNPNHIESRGRNVYEIMLTAEGLHKMQQDGLLKHVQPVLDLRV